MYVEINEDHPQVLLIRDPSYRQLKKELLRGVSKQTYSAHVGIPINGDNDWAIEILEDYQRRVGEDAQVCVGGWATYKSTITTASDTLAALNAAQGEFGFFLHVGEVRPLLPSSTPLAGLPLSPRAQYRAGRLGIKSLADYMDGAVEKWEDAGLPYAVVEEFEEFIALNVKGQHTFEVESEDEFVGRIYGGKLRSDLPTVRDFNACRSAFNISVRWVEYDLQRDPPRRFLQARLRNYSRPFKETESRLMLALEILPHLTNSDDPEASIVPAAMYRLVRDEEERLRPR